MAVRMSLSMQLFQHDLARERLRHLDHRREIELFDGRFDRARRTGRGLFLSEPADRSIELPHLAVGAPTRDSSTGRSRRYSMRDLLEAACG